MPFGGLSSGGADIKDIGEKIKESFGQLTELLLKMSKDSNENFEKYRANLTRWFDYPRDLNQQFTYFMRTIEPLIYPFTILLIVIGILLTLLVFRCAWVAFLEVCDAFREYCVPRRVILHPGISPSGAVPTRSPLLQCSGYVNPGCEEGQCERERTSCEQGNPYEIRRDSCHSKAEKKKVRFSMSS